MRERCPLMKKVRMLLLFNPVTEWVDRTRLFRYYLHEKTDHSQQKEVCFAPLPHASNFLIARPLSVGPAFKGANQSVCGVLQD